MRRISMAARDELVAAVADRYARGDRGERGRILDEFAAVTGYHRKHAMRLLRAGQVNRICGPRPGRRIYDEAVREALIVVWEASDRICGKRLRPLLPILLEAMERHGHLHLVPEVRTRLLAMSAATIDRALRDIRRQAGTATRRRSAPSAAIRRSVPVRTFADWDDPPPGFVEADLVAHSGPVARGSFVQTLVLTDIATGWTECAPLLVREQRLLTEVLGELRKNDQAWVEQKNGAVVRRTIGYRRFEGLEAAAALARLYAAMRLFVNFFQPSFKLAAKVRDGALVRKRYHPPATPCQRLLADARTNEEVRRRVNELRATLDPVRLLQQIRAAQQQLVDIADRPALGEPAKPTSPTLEEFLSGLRTAWREGEVRPTSVVKAKPKRSRRRPDPFAAVTAELRGWFEAEPWHTSRELLERLQAQCPGVYPDGQLRTLQRRLKEWRREAAHQMVFGTMTADPGHPPGDGERTLVSSVANSYFSNREGGAKSPVDLPLRLDDATASPTTPQDQHQ
jgi:hypothetical protein